VSRCEIHCPTVRLEPRGSALTVLGVTGASAFVWLAVAEHGWLSLVVPLLLTAAVMGTLIGGAVAHHRAGVRRDQERRAHRQEVTTRQRRRPAPVRVTATASDLIPDGAVWPSDRLDDLESPEVPVLEGVVLADRPAIEPRPPVVSTTAALEAHRVRLREEWAR